MRGRGGRYAHAYNGDTTSRGSRFLSKLYKGVPKGGNLDRAFKEVASIREKTKIKLTLTKRQFSSIISAMFKG